MTQNLAEDLGVGDEGEHDHRYRGEARRQRDCISPSRRGDTVGASKAVAVPRQPPAAGAPRISRDR
jgi:hypothetical protein